MLARVPHARETDLGSSETVGTMRRFDSPVSTLVLTISACDMHIILLP